MPTPRPELTEYEDVINYYVDSGEAPFRVYQGANAKPDQLRYSYEEDSTDEGQSILAAGLQKILDTPENTNTYLLQVLRSTGKGKPVVATSITFRLNKVQQGMQSYPMMGMQPGDSGMKALLTQTLETNRAILAKLNTQPEEPEETEDEKRQALIMGILDHPVVAQVAGPILGALTERIANWIAPPAGAMPVRMGAIEENASQDALINDAIAILKQHDEYLGSDLMRLANIAKTNKPHFDMLLKMLRG